MAWNPPTGGTGDVTGPASATDENIAVYDGTTGKLIKDGGAAIADLVADSEWTAKGDLVGASAASTPSALNVGANDTMLMADSGEATGLKWGTPATVRTALNVEDGADVTDATNVAAAGAAMDADWTAKGDILGASAASTPAALNVGANDTMLMADSGEASGLKWAAKATVLTALNVADGADVTASNAPQAHAASHTSGVDDIQDATNAVKGLATAAQITTLEGLDTNALLDTDFAAKGDILGASAASTPAILTVGANDTMLMADSGEASGLKWAAKATVLTALNVEDGADVTDATNVDAAGAVMESDFAAKGDLLGASAASTPAILTVGVDGRVLVADSGEATGLSWNDASGLDYTAIHDDTADEIHSITDAVITASDVIVFEDATDSWNKKSDTVQGILDLAGGGGAFSTTSNVTSNDPGTLGTDDFVFGSDQLDDDGDATHDDRMFFDKSIGAFGAGRAQSTEWDLANRGDYSARFGNNCKASGNYSTASGTNTTASGLVSTAFGQSTTAGNNYTTAIDYAATATGVCATASGLSATASGYCSTASGGYALANHYAESAYAAGRFAANGDAQYSDVVWRIQTTDATADVEMFLNGVDERLTLSDQDCYAFDILLVARRQDADDEGFAYQVKGCIDRNGATTALVGAVTTTPIADDSGGTLTVLVDADAGNNALRIRVTGEAGKTFRWVAQGRLVKVNG